MRRIALCLLVALVGCRSQPATPTAATRPLSLVELLQKADEAEKAWDLDGAVGYLTEALRLKADAATHLRRGSIYLKQSETDLALGDANDAIRLSPNSWEAYRLRAKVRMASLSPRKEEALADLTKAISLHPENADLYAERGAIPFDESSLDDLGRALSIQPKHEGALRSRAAIYKLLAGRERFQVPPNQQKARGLWEKAIADYTALIAIEPSDERAYSERATCYDAIDQPEKAKEDQRKAEELREAAAIKRARQFEEMKRRP